MTGRYVIEWYEDDKPGAPPDEVAYANTPRDARRIAARMLGHATLRGASTWERWQGGTVYQFGPRTESNGYDFVMIEEQEEG